MTKPETLRSVLRQPPVLTSEDSVYRAVEMLRHGGSETLPVVNARGALVGVLGMCDLRPLLEGANSADVSLGPAAVWARRPAVVGSPRMSAEEARCALLAGEDTTLFIVDGSGRYLGGVSMADLLAPSQVRARPASAGGMATLWGVHLHTGTVEAGSGALQLLASGAVLGSLVVSAYALVGLLAFAVQATTHASVFSLFLETAPPQLSLRGIGWYVLHASIAPVFLVLLRMLPLTGYHAAEHQAVHALERGEPLCLPVVRRMPRVHPRCGTNLLAAGIIFTAVSQLVAALGLTGLDSTDGAILGGVVALFTWRSLGSIIQQHFTTKPATDKQLAAGIAAAEQLERRYAESVPAHPTIWRRLWCAGVGPTLLGACVGASTALAVVSWALFALADRLPH